MKIATVMMTGWLLASLASAEEPGGELARAIRTIHKLEERIQQLEESQKAMADGAAALSNRVGSSEAKLNKITNGWFLIRSSMTGNYGTYVLDVRDGRADGLPVLQLAGDNNATPQPNRKWQLQLLD